MRLPWDKVYRAFPELDRFSDEECERYILQVKAQKKIGPYPGLLTFGSVLLCIIFGAPIGGKWLFEGPATGPDAVFMLRGAALICGFAGVPAFTYCITRDVRLRRALRARIDNARCPTCKQSLLGLPLIPGAPRPAVRCTECGGYIELSTIGLTPTDILPREN
jgi:hypothetical protein